MNISEIISVFLNQKIQSEAEVRSKLIVPLLEALGYSVDFRGEEFPVYGSEGSRELHAKQADFLQFTSNEFSMHRSKNAEDIKWVYEHSLLVFEAKKPTENIEVKGQPVYYAAWTRSPAYMISNGKIIEGYIVNANYVDQCIFSCAIEDIPKKWPDICRMEYSNVLCLKKRAQDEKISVDVDVYEKYLNNMSVRCADELYCNVERMFTEDVLYHPELNGDGKTVGIEELLSDNNKIITSEPGGGKSCLMWMLMRELLAKRRNGGDKIPIVLEGKYYGKLYSCINEGIYHAVRRFVTNVTKENIEEQVQNGKFIILFDAFDEVENDIDLLQYELIDIGRNTENIVYITSRIQNYKGDFVGNFEHYKLDPLSDQRITELLNKLSGGGIHFNIHHIPRRLLELIRIPLFLKMFVKTAKVGEEYRIPVNQASLFALYIEEKLNYLRCNLYEKEVIKRILSEYAVYSYEYGECTQKFSDILEKITSGLNREKIFNYMWKSGFISQGEQGVRYLHKTFMEFFYAYELSQSDVDKIKKWLSENSINEKYIEIICFLTGIISNQSKQNIILDYLEENNLRLYVRALKARRNFRVEDEQLDNACANLYFEQILKSYTTLIDSHFAELKMYFDGYRVEQDMICLKGSIDMSKARISLVIYNGKPDINSVEVTLSNNVGMKISTADGVEIPINSFVFTQGDTHYRGYSLDMLGYGFDSSREIALDIVKQQVIQMMKGKSVFDRFFPVLMCEYIEKQLKKLRHRINDEDVRKNLTLYSNNIEHLIAELEEHTKGNQTSYPIVLACKILLSCTNSPLDYLDVQEDLRLKPRQTVYRYDELYSDEQLVKKVKKIIVLKKEAIHKITTQIIPSLYFPKGQSKLIGVVYRNDNDEGFQYINVRCNKNEDAEPILVFREKKVKMSLKSKDGFFAEQLQLIGKTEKDVIRSGSSVLWNYFGEYVFHDQIYEDIKKKLEKILN